MSLGRRLLKSQIRTSEIVKNTIFWALSLPKWPTLISGKFSKVEKFLWSVDFKKSQKCSIFFKKCQNSLLVSKRTHSWSLTTIDFLSACCVQFISTSKHGFFIKKACRWAERTLIEFKRPLSHSLKNTTVLFYAACPNFLSVL